MLLQLAAQLSITASVYFPGAVWEQKTPEESGFDSAKLAEAIEFAKSRETNFPKDFSTQEEIFGKKLGPLPSTRAGTNGLVIRHGYIVATFGDTGAVDPTYSAAKSYLSAVLGIAVRDKKIPKVTDPVANLVKDGGYDSKQNSGVTWEHHVRQVSEWEGSLWGKNHDFIGRAEYGQGERQARELKAPGEHYEYNDVRINRFALSMLKVFGKPVPDVLRDEIMKPIGASDTWKWVPYDNSSVEIGGVKMPSVSGGTRWGGGLWINALDHARFGLLYLRDGKWAGREILPAEYIRQSLTPGEKNPDYGYLWWLNNRGTQWPGTPTSSFAAVGFGSNTVWIDPTHDLVIVWRWHAGNGADFFKKVVNAIKK